MIHLDLFLKCLVETPLPRELVLDEFVSHIQKTEQVVQSGGSAVLNLVGACKGEVASEVLVGGVLPWLG